MPAGQEETIQSLSLPPSYRVEAFREGIERTTGDSRGKRKSVSNVTCGPTSYCSFRL